MRTAKTLIRLGGCPGITESSLGAQSLCWFCHVAAHVFLASLKSHTALFINEPQHDKTYRVACAPSEDSDQPGYPPSLIRVFAVRMKEAWVHSYPLSTEQRAKTLIRLGGCPGWSESSLGAHAIVLVLLWGGSIFNFAVTKFLGFQKMVESQQVLTWNLNNFCDNIHDIIKFTFNGQLNQISSKSVWKHILTDFKTQHLGHNLIFVFINRNKVFCFIVC